MERRIYRMMWRHEGHRYDSMVGKPDVRLGEEVSLTEGVVPGISNACRQGRGHDR